MVLLYGIPGDGPFELVADALEAANKPFVIVNPQQFKKLDFIFYIEDGIIKGELVFDATSYPLEEFTGIYNRGIEFSAIPEAALLDKNSAEYMQYNQMFQVLNQWIEIADCRVVNKGSAMSSNGSKPYQSTLIYKFFPPPPTLVTNSPSLVLQYQRQHGEIIYKSASSVRSVVRTISNNKIPNLSSIRHCPTLFQQRLVGCNYRVHVIGKKVFAVKAASQTVDYRYSSREGEETHLTRFTLPKIIADKCIALASSLNLAFAGIDLFLTTTGKWYCFEVNPSPGFSYFEKHTGQPIAKTLATYLSTI
jgi:glutathione synthase/RimK-type ligase-like ATP-grasp enzyme